MPDREAIENRERQRGLSEIKEHGLSQAFVAEGGEDDGKSKVHGIDGTGGQQEPALRLRWKLEETGKQPGAEDHWERDETSSQREFPCGRCKGDMIQRNEYRRR